MVEYLSLVGRFRVFSFAFLKQKNDTNIIFSVVFLLAKFQFEKMKEEGNKHGYSM